MILSALSQIFAQLSYFILHVTSQGSFPRPLTAKEERLLLQRYKEEGDMEARSKLIEHNLRLVAHIIKKYYSSQRDQDDQQEGQAIQQAGGEPRGAHPLL